MAQVDGPQVPGDSMVFWWPTGIDPDTYDAHHGRAMDMAVGRYKELYGGEGPDAEIIGKLAMVSDLEGDD
jgi:inorganic pyrophosphatase